MFKFAFENIYFYILKYILFIAKLLFFIYSLNYQICFTHIPEIILCTRTSMNITAPFAAGIALRQDTTLVSVPRKNDCFVHIVCGLA